MNGFFVVRQSRQAPCRTCDRFLIDVVVKGSRGKLCGIHTARTCHIDGGRLFVGDLLVWLFTWGSEWRRKGDVVSNGSDCVNRINRDEEDD